MQSIEDIYAALFALVRNRPEFKFTSRSFRKWDDVPGGDQPAIFQRQHPIGVSQQQDFGLPKYTLRASWWIYCQYSPDEDTTPVTLLNSLMQVAINVLGGSTDQRPVAFQELQTLGGLVTNAWIDGQILVNEGVVPNDSTSIAVIPITLITAA